MDSQAFLIGSFYAYAFDYCGDAFGSVSGVGVLRLLEKRPVAITV